MTRASTFLVVLVVMACAAPDAGAVTTIGEFGGAGPDAGLAVRITAGGRSNDIAIALSAGRTPRGPGTTFRIVDRRDRVRVDHLARQLGCRVRDRHTVVCRAFPTPLAYVFLGGGDDRLTVTGAGRRFVLPPAGPAPDGLAGMPHDEGGEGSFLGWRIEGGPGDDHIGGSPYFDHIVGGPGSDVLDGRAGADLFEERGERGTDRIAGGSGHDALLWTSAKPLGVDLRSGRFTGGTVRSIDRVQGGSGDDTLVGSDREELLQGSGGADAIAGLGGADLLVGDGVYAQPSASDTIDAGAGNDLIDVSNAAYNPYGPTIDRTAPGPMDRLSCGEGSDRVDTTSAQVVPADCEGARFQTAAVPLRPAFGAGGALVYDVPCPAHNPYGTTVGTCDGTLTLTRPADGAVLGAARFAARGGEHAAVTVMPSAAVTGIGPLGVHVVGSFDNPRPDDMLDRFDFGWALAL